MDSLESLIRQAARLRFLDPGLEAKFYAERYDHGLIRMRLLFGLSMAIVAFLGWQEVNNTAPPMPDYAGVSLVIRFLVIIPIYAVLLASTWVPKGPERAELVLGVGLTAVCWSLGILKWHAVDYFEWERVSAVLQLDILTTLLISIIGLPMRFRTGVLLCVASTSGITVWFALTHLSQQPDLQLHLGTNLGAFVLFAVILQWFRERAERRDFAQREHMKKLNQDLAQLNREKSEFMMIAAHDLRSPLAILKLGIEILQQRRSSQTQLNKAWATQREQVDRMLRLVNNFLGAQAIKTGLIDLWTEEFDLREVANASAERFRTCAAAKQQALICQLPDESVTVTSDVDLLAQVVDNFVTNALKFSPTGASITLHITTEKDGRWARLAVADDGPGIPIAEQTRLFQPFGLTSVKPSGNEPCHGLGLASAKGIVERLEGRVGFDSEPGRGSTFWFELQIPPP